jgi:dihydroxy-acid dehydratase
MRLRPRRRAAGRPTQSSTLLALAREVGVELTIDEIDRISRRTPLLCDLKPGGRFAAVDLYRPAASDC